MISPFFLQADKIVNIQGYWEKGPLEARIAWRLQGDALLEVGGSTAQDLFITEREVVDLNFSYKINKRLSRDGAMLATTAILSVGTSGMKHLAQLTALV